MQLTEREKAALIVGMVRAFEAASWPDHFNEDDIAGWRWAAKIGYQILGGGAFNPLDAWRFRDFADAEMAGQTL